MQELITQLIEKAGLNADQAAKAIDTVKDFIKEKFPMLGGAVDNMFPAAADNTTAANTAAPHAGEGSMLDKISDFIPGQAGEQIEDFAKGIFGGDKK